MQHITAQLQSLLDTATLPSIQSDLGEEEVRQVSYIVDQLLYHEREPGDVAVLSGRLDEILRHLRRRQADA